MPLTPFIFPASITQDKHGWWQVRFPDLPDALTSGGTKEEAEREAANCLTMALYVRIEKSEGVPIPSAVKRGMVGIAPEPEISLKAALHEAMRKQSVTKAELARRLETNHKEACRITNPGHKTKLTRLTQALHAVGRQVVIGVTKKTI